VPGSEEPPTDPDGATSGGESTTDGPVTARRINSLLLSLGETVAETRRRGAAERATCEGLVDPGLYRSAWVGVRTPDGEGLVVRASAGPDDPGRTGSDVDADAAAGVPPWATALRSGAVQVADVADLAGVDWPTEVAEGSVAAIPLGRGDTVDGVLVAHAERRNAFGELERSGLAVLGTTLGLTVDAVRSRELFFADSVVEIELRIADSASLLARVSGAHACRLSLEGYAASGDRWRLQCDVTGADPAVVADALTEDPDVERCRVVIERSDGGRLEVETTDLPLLRRAAAAGATVETALADHGACRVTLQQPASGDVCETVARLRATFPDLDFLSLREVDHGPTQPAVAGGVLDELTDRQREAIAVAYDAGYFEWPRGKTAEEIAPELGITSPTLHWHLREAQRRLLSTLLEDDPGR
jgi:hypothetical protein